MLPKAQKEVFLSRQDLRQLWGPESDRDVTDGPPGSGADLPRGRVVNGQRQGSVGAAFCFSSSEQPFKRGEGCSEKGIWVAPHLRCEPLEGQTVMPL